MAKSKAFTVVINSISNFSGYTISIILGLISYPIIIEQIGIEAVGIYALMMTILAPMDLTNLGFAEATIKYASQFIEQKDFDTVRKYISTTLLMSIIVGVVGMIIIFFLGPIVAYALFDFSTETRETIQLCFGMVAIGWLVRQLTAVFLALPTAFQRFKIVAIGNSITSIVTTVSILSTLYFIRNLTGYTFGTLIGAVLSLLFWFIIGKINFTNISYSIKFYKEVWRTSFMYGGWQTIGSVGSLVTSQTDKYLLGIYLPASASGVYNVIFQIQQRILSAIWKIAEVMFPLFSASSHQDFESKFRTLVRSNYILSALGVIIFFPFIILARPTLNIWINTEFASLGYVVMRCLLLVGAFASFTVVQNFFLMGNARVKQVTLITYFTGGFTAIGSLILIPIYGLDGAAYGVLFAAISRMGLFYFLMKRLFQSAFNGQDYLIASLLPLIPGVVIASIFIYYPILEPDNLIVLIIDYAMLAAVLVASIIFVNFLLPRARRHNAEITRFINEFRGVIFKR